MGEPVGNTQDDWGNFITSDPNGNVYVTGSFVGTVDFDPSTVTQSLTSLGGSDIYLQKFDVNGNLIWVKQMGGTGNDIGFSIAVDATGNVYSTGIFRGTADFDPSAGIQNLSSNGDADIYIQKLDASGNFIWAKQVGGSQNDYGFGIITDNQDQPYLVGSFQGSVDFDPNGGLNTLTSSGDDDVFVLKLTDAGNFVWANRFGGSAFDYSREIRIDAAGDLYCVGRFSGSVDFDPSSATQILNSNGGHDVFILKMKTDGSLTWVKQIGGPSNDFAYGMCTNLLGEGGIYITGHFNDSVDFDPGSGTHVLSSNGGQDVFVEKLDAFGNFVWVRTFGGTMDDFGYSIACDSVGDVYYTGSFQGTVDFNPQAPVNNATSSGDQDIFICKLTQLGNFSWATQMGDNLIDVGLSIDVNSSGTKTDIHTTGYFHGTDDFDPGSSTSTLTSSGGRDVFIQKLSNSQFATSINESKLKNIIIYPNPTSGILQLDLQGEIADAVIIYDLAGHILYYGREISSQKIVFDSPPGVYLIQIKIGEDSAITKFTRR